MAEAVAVLPNMVAAAEEEDIVVEAAEQVKLKVSVVAEVVTHFIHLDTQATLEQTMVMVI